VKSFAIVVSLLGIGVSLSCAAGEGNASQPLKYDNQKCHYSFSYPANWRIAPNPIYVKSQCAVTLRPKDFDDRIKREENVDTYTLVVDSVEGGFEKGATAVGFEKDDKGQWIGFESEDTEKIQRGSSLGLRGTFPWRYYSEGGEGGYAGMGENPRAFLTDGKQSVTLNGYAQSEDAFDMVFNTIKVEQALQ